MRDSAAENRKNARLMTWALRSSPMRRFLPSNPHNNWLYAAAATKIKTLQQNPFTHHQHSVTVSDDDSWQVKIGLHQLDNYLSQVKINITTNSQQQLFLAILKISGEFFVFEKDSAQTHWAREAISFLASNLAKCWLILKLFYKRTQQRICS